jgi:ribose 5-phosphate isomerase A
MSFLTSLSPPVAAFDLIKIPTTADEIGKRSAARRAIDEYVTSGMSIGVGSGSTIVYGIQRLAERVWGDEGLKIKCVPTSFQTKEVSD